MARRGMVTTTIAQSLAEVFSSVIYIPYAVMIDGQIMRVFDPSLHIRIESTAPAPTSIFNTLRREQYGRPLGGDTAAVHCDGR